jgi:UDP-N-acetylmuramoylalanine--D-glutamate ligase
MGLGRFGGGLDTALFACRAGANVTVTDLANAEQLSDSLSQLKEFPDIEFHLGGHNPGDFERADIVIVNPAVPPDNEFLQIAKQNNKRIASQIGIFFELCPATIIGITGANGKSTTAALTAHLLKSASQTTTSHESRVTSHKTVRLSGNIGNEPLLTILDEITRDDLVVLELSSFQIEQLAQIRKAPHVALLTNLTPNHLDRYGTFEAYCAAKENIFNLQQNDWDPPAVSIFNAEDKIASEWFDKYSKDQGKICIRFSRDDVGDDIRRQFRLPGRANLSNLAAALAVARHFGVDNESVKTSLPDFKALPHRLELVAEINGVRWYNDSKATTPEGAITALEAFDEPQIIIAGGYDKHIPFDELGKKIAEKAKAAILFGQTAEKIAASIHKSLPAQHKRDTRPVLSAVEGYETCPKRPVVSQAEPIRRTRDTNVVIVNSLSKAVSMARQLAAPGDVVLLSPACASYDMFENYEHRGRQFATLVRHINA